MAHAKNEHWWLAVDRHCLVGYVPATYMAVEYDKGQERKAIKERRWNPDWRRIRHDGEIRETKCVAEIGGINRK